MKARVVDRRIFWSGLGLYLAGMLFFLSFYYVKIDPDGTSYLRLVEYYAAGRIDLAVNAYWSPLVVWLLVPIEYFGTVEFWHYKLLLGIFGAFILAEFWAFRAYFNWLPQVQYFGFALLIVVLWRYTMAHNSPDIISVYLLLRYLRLLWQWQGEKRFLWRQGLTLGLVGALLYFSKSYNFAYFLVHFTAWQFWLYWHKRASLSHLLQRAAPALLIFFALSGIWVGLLYQKYGVLTLSQAGFYNHALMSPYYQRQHPMFFEGLIAPAHAEAVAVWEDPSKIEMRTWSPFTSTSNLAYQALHVTSQNLMDYFQKVNPFWIVVWLVGLLQMIPFNNRQESARWIFWLTSIFLYIAGYSLILIEPRYTWLGDFLSFFLALELISELSKQVFFKLKWRYYCLLIFFALAFVIRPLKDHLAYCLNGYPQYASRYGLGKEERFRKLMKGAEWASQNRSDCWHYSLALAYQTGGHYWGETKPNAESSEILAELKAHNIRYYLVWQSDSSKLDLPLVYHDKKAQLKVYEIP